MKSHFFALLALLGISLLSLHSEACTPQLFPLQQSFNMATVLRSDAYTQALYAELDKDSDVAIEKVEPGPRVRVFLSNQCVIEGTLLYDAPEDPGLCPKFKGVKVQSLCPN